MAADKPSDSLLEDLEVYRAVAEHFRHDLRIFWDQTNAFIVIDGVLITGFVLGTPSTQGIGPGALLASFGLAITTFWAWTSWQRVELVDRWRSNLVQIDAVVDRFKFYVSLEQSIKAKPLSSPTHVTKYLPWLIGAFWVVSLVFFLLTHVSPTPAPA